MKNRPPGRIVVTGIGAVTPVGAGRREAWANLLAGKSGISEVESFDTSNYSVHRGGEVKGFDPRPWFSRLDVGPIVNGWFRQRIIQRHDDADAPQRVRAQRKVLAALLN